MRNLLIWVQTRILNFVQIQYYSQVPLLQSNKKPTVWEGDTKLGAGGAGRDILHYMCFIVVTVFTLKAQRIPEVALWHGYKTQSYIEILVLELSSPF